MENKFSVSNWTSDVLGFGEEFSIAELHRALNAKTTEERKRVSRNLSYLVQKGTLKRLKRGKFKNLNCEEDFSGHIQSVSIDYCKDEDSLVAKFSKFREFQGQSGYGLVREPLWNYKNCTAELYQTCHLQNRNKVGYSLLINENDPQLERVVRYVGRKSMGNSLAIFLNGQRNLTSLFPNITWL